jgi:hypothetical protein
MASAKGVHITGGQFGFVLALFLVLMALAHLGAEASRWQDEKRENQWLEKVAANQPVGPRPVAHTVIYYRIIFTIWATILLLTPALCFYVLRRPSVTSSYWLLFWTFSYLAYLTHFYWATELFHWDQFQQIFSAKEGMQADPEKVVEHPIPDLILTVWWGIDVILAWIITYNPRLVQIQRGVLQLVTFIMFVGASVLASKAEIVARLLGITMVLAVTSCFVLRIIIRPIDPGSFLATLYVQSFNAINRFAPWYRLPNFLAVMNLGTLREVLRAKNLTNTSDIPVTRPAGRSPLPKFDSAYLEQLEVDGYFNDLHKPEMGTGSMNSEPAGQLGDFTHSNPGARFGRNFPREVTYPESGADLLSPSPREVSRQLLARKPNELKEAKILNYLAAAWIQFETHDWFFHGNPVKDNPIQIGIDASDSWPERPMQIRRTRPDPTRDYAAEERASKERGDRPPPPTYVNAESHWWDASQIYGSDLQTAMQLRRANPLDPNSPLLAIGKLFVDTEGLLPRDPTTRAELSGFTGNWWLGLTLLHTLFTREHNAICDRLHEEYPSWSDERVYQTARLVNAALMAKIHTVEWTPAILKNPVLRVGMNTNWWGLAGEPIKKVFGRISENDAFSGLTGSETNHHTADYALTEEFVSVYRLHPLIRDDMSVCRLQNGEQIGTLKMMQMAGDEARQHALDLGATMPDLFYSFGICSPGAIALQNYPDFLRDFYRPDKDHREHIDLAAIDIMRDRERGVPRYNQFRELLHLPSFRSIDHMIQESDQLRQSPNLAQSLRKLYDDKIDRVDLMVGLFAETFPPGFGFGDTAFRIFILMASRRVKSNRFFTTDFTPKIYSQAGFDWVNDNTMFSLLLRHYPELAPALRGVDNAFAPWKTIAQSQVFQPYEGADGNGTAE